MPMAKKRVDLLIAERGLTESRTKAQRLIQAGEVRVDGQLVHKASTEVPEDAEITLEAKLPFVSRGGRKLDAALEHFAIDVTDAVAADVGASTGGFTDCLLQRGVRLVYAIDAGYGQLHYKLRQDPRVVVMERTNARHLRELPEPIDVVTVDVSFISLDLILPNVAAWVTPRADVVALIKPQFEAGPQHVERGGVVHDPEVHRQVLDAVLATAEELFLGLRGLMRSPLTGPAGNVEFLAWWQPGEALLDHQAAINACLADSPQP